MSESVVDSRLNDFVIRFANVNGTGSASANGLVGKAFFRMGLPIGPKNMFPSNIQGLPTWYEIRVSEKGFTSRLGRVDIMVAMNPQTFLKDLESLAPGGYFVYDESRYHTGSFPRDDVTPLPLPLTTISQRFPLKVRPLLKNIVYVGALGALLDIDTNVVKGLLKELFHKKPKLLESNLEAYDIGYEMAGERFSCPLPVKVEARQLNDGKILMEGNEALGLGCVYAGATVASWYPITPSTSVVDAFTKYCDRFRKDPQTGENSYAIIQAEDEIAAIGMVLGANWNGARSFTATSGPGISLMSEFLGYAYYAEIPAVIFNIQRVGPSTGMPTRTQQADLLLCAYASHGDTKHILLFPSTPSECFQMAVQAFDLAERFQTPVLLLSDLELAMNEFLMDELTWDDAYSPNRGKVWSKEQLDDLDGPFYRYEDRDGDGVAYRTLPNTHPRKGANLTRGSGHDRFGRYTEDGALYQDNMDRIARKFDGFRNKLPEPAVDHLASNKKVGVVYLGTTIEPLREAADILKNSFNIMGIKSFPFHDQVTTFIMEHEFVIVIDQNRDAQLKNLLLMETDVPKEKLHSLRFYDGMPMTAKAVAEAIGGEMKKI